MRAGRILFWAPRTLGLLFAIFLSLFALDVFAQHQGFWQTAGALLLHLVPTFLVLLAIAIAWWREWIGAVLFIGLAVFYVATTWGRFPLSTYLSIAGPLTVLGALFLIDGVYRAHPRAR